MDGTFKKILKYVFSAVLAAALLWFSFRDVDWQEFKVGLKTFRWDFIALSMSAGATAFLLRGLRWRMLLLPFDSSVRRLTAFNGVNIGNISNLVLPRIGELVRCGVVTRRTAIPYDKVLGTVVLERGWELIVMLLLFVVVVFAGFDRFGEFFRQEIWTPLSLKWWIVPALLALGALALYFLWAMKMKSRLCGKVWGVIAGVFQGFTSCFRMEKKWMFFMYTLLIWVVYWFMSMCIVWAATSADFAGLDLIDALFLSIVGGLGFAVPVPGGIGAYHFIIQLALFKIYGIPLDMGLVFATVSHTSQALTQILFGLGSYAYESIRK